MEIAGSNTRVIAIRRAGARRIDTKVPFDQREDDFIGEEEGLQSVREPGDPSSLGNLGKDDQPRFVKRNILLNRTNLGG